VYPWPGIIIDTKIRIENRQPRGRANPFVSLLTTPAGVNRTGIAIIISYRANNYASVEVSIFFVELTVTPPKLSCFYDLTTQ